MKITFVTHSMNPGGAERVLAVLANCFVKNGIQVDFIVSNDDHKLFYPLEEGIGVYFTPSPYLNKLGSLSKIVKSLRQKLDLSAPDVVISFFPAQAVYSKLALRGKKVPIIYSERNDPNNNIKGIVMKTFQFLALKFSKRVVFQTAGARDYYGRSVRKKATIILNPFDSGNLPEPPRMRTKTIVSVGRLFEQKNQRMQIRAFKRISEKYPEYRLEIYGEGPLRGALEAQIAECGLEGRVELKGAHTDVLERINTAEIFLFSSRYEGLPNAVIEAMALGLPCVCTKCSPGGAEALIENHKNGILVDVDDEEQMIKEVLYLIEHPQERARIAAKASEIVDRLEVKTIADQWIEEIKGII